MKVIIEIEEDRDGADAAIVALKGEDFRLAVDEALLEMRSKIESGMNNPENEDEDIAFRAGVDFARQVLIDALEARSLSDLVIV